MESTFLFRLDPAEMSPSYANRGVPGLNSVWFLLTRWIIRWDQCRPKTSASGRFARTTQSDAAPECRGLPAPDIPVLFAESFGSRWRRDHVRLLPLPRGPR